jgi:hypothetical protein
MNRTDVLVCGGVPAFIRVIVGRLALVRIEGWRAEVGVSLQWQAVILIGSDTAVVHVVRRNAFVRITAPWVTQVRLIWWLANLVGRSQASSHANVKEAKVAEAGCARRRAEKPQELTTIVHL